MTADLVWEEELLAQIHADRSLDSLTVAQVSAAVTLAVDFAQAKVAEAAQANRAYAAVLAAAGGVWLPICQAPPVAEAVTELTVVA